VGNHAEGLRGTCLRLYNEKYASCISNRLVMIRSLGRINDWGTERHREPLQEVLGAFVEHREGAWRLRGERQALSLRVSVSQS
jgi:hypothetical protein